MRMGRARHSGFTLLEMVIIVLVLAIIAALGCASLSAADAGMRADRAGRECIEALRAARVRALTTGAPTCVRIDPAAGAISVCDVATAQPIAQPLLGTTYAYTLRGRPELAGTTLTIRPQNQATEFAYSTLGDCSSAGTIDFAYGGHHVLVDVERLGEPTLGTAGVVGG